MQAREEDRREQTRHDADRMSVTAKPFTGPVPNWYRMTPDTTTVTWVSMTVRERPPEAGVDRGPDGLPEPQLLADALEDEDVGVDRHADGQHDAGDARQRQRGLNQRHGRQEDERG